MHTLWNDLRYALRQLRKDPGFTLTAVMTLGLGLGAAATMFNVVDDVLLAPLPYTEPRQLVGVGFTYPQAKPNAEQMGISADFLRAHSRSFSSLGVAEDGNTGVNLSFTEGGAAAGVTPVQVHARHVSAGYLQTLGITPMLGRGFAREEDLPHGPQAVILGYALWRQSFHQDRAIVGRVIHLNEEPYTVVGVMPRGFADPSTSEPTQLWTPLQLSPDAPGYDGDNYIMIARLRQGVSREAARAEVATFNQPFYKANPYYLKWTNSAKSLHEYRIWPLAQVLTSNVRASVIAMAAAVFAVLLIACLSVAGLMTTRGAERSREIAIRRALGASRYSLIRLLLTEGLLLAFASAGLAIVFASSVTPALLATTSLSLPVLGAVPTGLTAIFVLAASLAGCLLFSLLPASQAIGNPMARTMPGRSTTGMDRSQTYLGRVLVVAQVALAMVLLSGASLLLSTFLKIQSTSPGFLPQHLVVGQVTLKGENYATTRKTTQFVNKVLARLEYAPGVLAAGAIDGLPLDRGLNMAMFPAGHRELAQTVEFRALTPGYFHTLNLSLLNGRAFTDSDSAGTPEVAVISETAARKWWPKQSPIGQRVMMQGKEPMPMQIVGIVSDTRNNALTEPANVMIYSPYAQMPDDLTKIINGWISTSFVLRTSADAPLAQLIQQAVSEADPAMPIAKISSMQSVIDETVAAPKFFSVLSSGFAGFALLLTILGLFGLLSYQVAQRRRELGLRLALGATRKRVLASVMQRGLLLAALGLAIGLVGSSLMPGLLATMLGDVIYTGDAPITSILAGSTAAIGAACLAVLSAALFASYLPARRAANTEPMEALRSE